MDQKHGDQQLLPLKLVFINSCHLRNQDQKTSNKNLRQRTKQEPVIQSITPRKWRWIGHTLSKGNTNITPHALESNHQGHRKRGRSKNT